MPSGLHSHSAPSAGTHWGAVPPPGAGTEAQPKPAGQGVCSSQATAQKEPSSPKETHRLVAPATAWLQSLWSTQGRQSSASGSMQTKAGAPVGPVMLRQSQPSGQLDKQPLEHTSPSPLGMHQPE